MVVKRKIGENTKPTNNCVQRTVSDFLNDEYRQFSNYVISTRACPSLIDGLKVGARKLLHAAFKGGLKDGSEKKLPTLIGDCYVHSFYQHGDASSYGTAVTMGSEFIDNLHPLEIPSQHGSLRDPKSCAAPRYLFCKLSKYSKLYKVDEDLLEYVFDEGEYLEPVYYLPIIPLTLTARNEGMAPGYKFQTFSYHPIDIIDACTEVIKTGKVKTKIRPFVRGINQDNFGFDNETGRWYNVGQWTTDEANDVITITDLPYDVTFEKFEKKLNAYIDKEYIKDWKNYSHDNVIEYKIIFNKSKLARELQPDRKEQTYKNFMLQTYIPNDLLYVLDENGKVKHFATKEDLLIYFVNFRLEQYGKRKDILVKIKEKQLSDNSDICKFIELVTSGKLIINNRKIADVKADMAKHGLPDKLLGIQVSKLTQEEKDMLLKKNKEIQDELDYIINTTTDQMYINDLKELKKELNKDF